MLDWMARLLHFPADSVNNLLYHPPRNLASDEYLHLFPDQEVWETAHARNNASGGLYRIYIRVTGAYRDVWRSYLTLHMEISLDQSTYFAIPFFSKLHGDDLDTRNKKLII